MAYHDYKPCKSCGKKDNDWRMAHCSNCLAELPPTTLKVEVKGKKRDNPFPRQVLFSIWSLLFLGAVFLGDSGAAKEEKEAEKSGCAKESTGEIQAGDKKKGPMDLWIDRTSQGAIAYVPVRLDYEFYAHDTIPPGTKPGPYEPAKVELVEVPPAQPRRAGGILAFRPGHGPKGRYSPPRRQIVWEEAQRPAPPPPDPNAPKPAPGFSRFYFQTSP